MNVPETPPPARRVLPVRFTGSGSEYFRIWIVNLLLMLVTLGLYYPFAKARRLRYFHGNTVVDGDALGFHGDPWKMFRGFVLMLLLGIAYSVASRFDPLAAVVAISVFAALWPALWRASLQFRLGNTSWRGVRMRFEGSLGGAYRAMAPLALPVLLSMAVTLLARPDGQLADAARPVNLPPWLMWLPLVSMLTVALIWPWWMAMIKRYQHDHYRYADQRSRLTVGVGAFYGVALRTLVVGVAVVVCLAVLAAGPLMLVRGMGHDGRGVVAIGSFGLALIAYVAVLLVPGTYWMARLQNLVWSGTRSDQLRIRSNLRARALIGLTLKNLLLTTFTLGLYRPFAAVAMARLKLEAVQVRLDGDPALWAAGRGVQDGDAAGDFAGDFFGIDIGL